MYLLLLIYKIPWWPVQRESGGEGKEICPTLYTVETSSEGKRQVQCQDWSTWRCTVRLITPTRWEGRESGREEGEQRRSRVHPFRLLFSWVIFFWTHGFICLLGCWVSVILLLLLLLPSSLLLWGERSAWIRLARVTPDRKQMVSFSLKRGSDFIEWFYSVFNKKKKWSEGKGEKKNRNGSVNGT